MDSPLMLRRPLGRDSILLSPLRRPIKVYEHDDPKKHLSPYMKALETHLSIITVICGKAKN